MRLLITGMVVIIGAVGLATADSPQPSQQQGCVGTTCATVTFGGAITFCGYDRSLSNWACSVQWQAIGQASGAAPCLFFFDGTVGNGGSDCDTVIAGIQSDVTWKYVQQPFDQIVTESMDWKLTSGILSHEDHIWASIIIPNHQDQTVYP